MKKSAFFMCLNIRSIALLKFKSVSFLDEHIGDL